MGPETEQPDGLVHRQVGNGSDHRPRCPIATLLAVAMLLLIIVLFEAIVRPTACLRRGSYIPSVRSLGAEPPDL